MLTLPFDLMFLMLRLFYEKKLVILLDYFKESFHFCSMMLCQRLKN